jgi:mRNA interferase RelE/StbE
VKYQISVAPTVLTALARITDRRVRDLLCKRISQLAEEPAQQGKPLLGEFAGYRTVRAAGQRYRIIYRVEEALIRVYVVAAGRRAEGSRRDVYTLARKLLRQRLLEPPEE